MKVRGARYWRRVVICNSSSRSSVVSAVRCVDIISAIFRLIIFLVSKERGHNQWSEKMEWSLGWEIGVAERKKKPNQIYDRTKIDLQRVNQMSAGEKRPLGGLRGVFVYYMPTTVNPEHKHSRRRHRSRRRVVKRDFVWSRGPSSKQLSATIAGYIDQLFFLSSQALCVACNLRLHVLWCWQSARVELIEYILSETWNLSFPAETLACCFGGLWALSTNDRFKNVLRTSLDS